MSASSSADQVFVHGLSSTVVIEGCGHSFMLEPHGMPQFVAAVHAALKPWVDQACRPS